MAGRAPARGRSIACAITLAFAGCADEAAPAASSGEPSAPASVAAPSASSSAVPSADPNAAIPLSKRFSAVGDRETRTKEKILTLKLDLKAGATTSREETTEETKVEQVTEVVEVEGELVTKIKVEYRQHNAKRKTVRGAAKEDSPLAGKSYFVELKAKKIVITGIDGKTPPRAELDELTSDHKQFGKGPRLLKALPDSVRVGDSLDEFAKVFSEAAAGGPEGEGDIKKASATVKAVREENGVRIIAIALDLRMEGKLASGMAGKVSMSGTIDIRTDRCWPVASQVSGPVELTFAGSVSGTAKGTLNETTSATYSP